jgi:hypothetical protein
MMSGVRSEGARKAVVDLADSDVAAVTVRTDSTGTARGFGVTHLPLINEDGAVFNGNGAVPGSA